MSEYKYPKRIDYSEGEPQGPVEIQPPEPEYPDALVTKDDIHKFTFSEYCKVGTTKLSDQILPIGVKIQTLEGEYICAEPSRLAIDAAGNVYPVAESIRVRTYRLASQEF